MTTRAKRTWLLIGLLPVIALPLGGSWLRRGKNGGCALDDMKIVPAYRVRILDDRGRSHEFCSIRCAEIWLKDKNMPTARVYVTDEASGAEVLAGDAHFVRSLVVTTRVSGNRVHAFRTRNAAAAHADRCRGTILEEADRPFFQR